MSVRPRPDTEVPVVTVRMTRAGNSVGTTATWVRDRLDGLRRDEDFADRYPRDGRPGLSPARSATVSVVQFLPGLSDRDAAATAVTRTGGPSPATAHHHLQQAVHQAARLQVPPPRTPRPNERTASDTLTP